MISPEKILEIFQSEIKKITSLSPTRKAKRVAHFYAPGFILSVVILYGFIDFGKGVAISELKTEITAAGDASSKRGVVIIAESASSNYQIPLAQNSSKIWSSLDAETARRNVHIGRLGLDVDGLYSITPFFDEKDPVTLVVEGDLGKDIKVAGETEPVEGWRLSSRRTSSLVPSVLINCFLALGIGAAAGGTTVDRGKDNATKKRAKPNKD